MHLLLHLLWLYSGQRPRHSPMEKSPQVTLYGNIRSPISAGTCSNSHKQFDYTPPFPVAPASFDGIVLSVAGITRSKGLDLLSNYGSEDAVLDFGGTSLATPIISGCASLIMGRALQNGDTLDFDDTYNLLMLGATRSGIDVGGRDPQIIGHGLPRPVESFKHLDFPNCLDRYVVEGPWTDSVETLTVKVNRSDNVHGECDAVIHHTLTATSNHGRPFFNVVRAWANGRLSAGAMRADEVHPDSTLFREFRGGTVTPIQWGEVTSYDGQQVEVRTHWYENIPGYEGAWPPTETEGAKVAVTVLGELALTQSPMFAMFDTAGQAITAWFHRPVDLPVDWNDVYFKVGDGDWSKIAAYPGSSLDSEVVVANIDRGSESYYISVEHVGHCGENGSGRGPAAVVYTRPNPPASPTASVVMHYPVSPPPEGLFGEMTTMGVDGPGDTTEPVATTEIDVS